MAPVTFDVPPEELTALEKLGCFVGPNGETYLKQEDSESGTSAVRVQQRWFTCSGCKSYFLGRKRVHEQVAHGDKDSEVLLCGATEFINGSEQGAEGDAADRAP
jgi:hypothetical protein